MKINLAFRFLSGFLFCLICSQMQAQYAPNVMWAKEFKSLTDNGFVLEITDIATDASGNIYTVGNFVESADFGTSTLTTTETHNCFVTRSDSLGNLAWAVKMNDYCKSVAVDPSGNIYVTGEFYGIGAFGSFTLNAGNGFDAFICKLDNAGTFLWAIKLGGTDDDYGNAIITNTSGDIYVVGRFFSSATFGTYTITSTSPFWSSFICKIDASSGVIWVKYFNGFNDEAIDVTVDAAGDVCVTGYFVYNTVIGAITLSSISSGLNNVAYVAKLNSSGTVLWAKQMSVNATLGINVAAIAHDASNNLFVTGVLDGNATIGSDALTGPGMYISKLDASGSFIWSKQAAGGVSASGTPMSLAISNAGDLLVTGYFTGAPVFGTQTLIASPSNSLISDVFVIEMNSGGNYIWAKQSDGPLSGSGSSICLDPSGNIYFAGTFSNIIFFGTNTLTANYGGSFLVKLMKISFVDLRENILNKGIIIYPNPAIDKLEINCGVQASKSECILFDNVGAEVKRSDISNGQTINLDISNLAPGVYFLKVNNNSEGVLKKVIIE